MYSEIVYKRRWVFIAFKICCFSEGENVDFLNVGQSRPLFGYFHP